jgi:hypothetical protein
MIFLYRSRIGRRQWNARYSWESIVNRVLKRTKVSAARHPIPPLTFDDLTDPAASTLGGAWAYDGGLGRAL